MAPFSDEFLFIEMANKVRNATACSKENMVEIALYNKQKCWFSLVLT